MKKVIKNPIFAFVLGAIIFSGITAYAATTILSKDVKFTPENTAWEVENVEEAINDLYSKKNNMYLFNAANSGNALKTVTLTNFEESQYYLCITNMRGDLDNIIISGADVVFELNNNSYLDSNYSNYVSYLKATSNDISFSYTATNTSNSNYGIGVKCFKFGEKMQLEEGVNQ